MTKKESFIALLIIIFARTAFLFGDAFFSAKQIDTQLAEIRTDNIVSTNNMLNADQKISNVEKDLHSSAFDKQDKTIVKNIETSLEKTKTRTASIKNTIKNSIQDIEILEKIYEQDDSPDVLKLLLPKLVEDYQFDKAKKYISDINIFQDESIDAQTYIYTYINSLSITDNTSMTKFMSFVDQLRYKSMIDSDDYIFYQGLAKLWTKDYDGANVLFAQIKSPVYTNFIEQVNNAINTFNNQKGVPIYYKDALVSLVAMKNGYFSLADKLAISSILQNPEYILPHQLLAYSNFLTNNREKSVENFYDLVELDSENQDKYNFYIGVAYYRWGNNQESILLLSQLLDNKEYKTDVYRYLLLNYQKLDDEQKMIQVRQKLLGQDDLVASDFKSFYDTVFYKPFSTDSIYTIYNKYKQLSYDFVSVCYEDLGQNNDTCLYGEAGLDIVNQSRQDVKNSLVYLAENYPQAYIFQALGDYYSYQESGEKAKTYYLKAESLAKDISQKTVIENKIISEIN